MDASQQFTRVEGLAQVIISTDFQARDAVHFFHFGRQHDDRCLHPSSTQAAANAQAVFTGQHQIQNHQIDGFTLQDSVQCSPVFGQQNVKAFLRQKTPQQIADAGVVVDDDDLVKAW